jgi:hypothetical protein
VREHKEISFGYDVFEIDPHGYILKRMCKYRSERFSPKTRPLRSCSQDTEPEMEIFVQVIFL